MKLRIIFMRHSEAAPIVPNSSQVYSDKSDWLRPLTINGNKIIQDQVYQFKKKILLQDSSWLPSNVYISDSVRTQQTWNKFYENLKEIDSFQKGENEVNSQNQKNLKTMISNLDLKISLSQEFYGISASYLNEKIIEIFEQKLDLELDQIEDIKEKSHHQDIQNQKSINSLSDKIFCIMFVIHNPGVSEILELLTQKIHKSLSPGSMVGVELLLKSNDKNENEREYKNVNLNKNLENKNSYLANFHRNRDRFRTEWTLYSTSV